ncbi:GNAT family N-acetyltransferase [Halostreptopolyspora alba]|uniref:N-acetyltransferase n=1 Tax=Halostreptopolyspora alba TaxID=2487137 RepID=A0A3N0EIE6_9ACTN|nr:N-acetyltransferase [Nocardiopsaceae bacterium YIM 96095]
MSWIEACDRVLKNDHVLLRPVTERDREPLRAIAFDPDIWRYFVSRVVTDEDFDALFDGLLADRESGVRAPFCIVDAASGRAAGSSSYGLTAERDGRLEIGWSWLGQEFRGGTGTANINRNAKYLLLTHAFEVLGAERVEFKTDELNERARRGLSAIGAREEGVLRSFNPMPDGRRRNAVFYSVLATEWPQVRPRLAGTLTPETERKNAS